MIKPDEVIKFLIDNGLIFEINRKVLHPLGLAMFAEVDRSNKKKLILLIQETDDLDGFIYDEEGFNVGKERFNALLEKSGQKRLNERFEKHGFIEQEK